MSLKKMLDEIRGALHSPVPQIKTALALVDRIEAAHVQHVESVAPIPDEGGQPAPAGDDAGTRAIEEELRVLRDQEQEQVEAAQGGDAAQPPDKKPGKKPWHGRR